MRYSITAVALWDAGNLGHTSVRGDKPDLAWAITENRDPALALFIAPVEHYLRRGGWG